jgi:predicted ArsR family transcriptional regulator
VLREAAQTETGLVDLLGDTRARIVEELRVDAHSVAHLATALGLSEVAVRRHLGVLERDGLVTAHTVRDGGPGRPGARYELTDKARRLFPDQSAQFANELLDYLEAEHGRQALLGFLRWRQSQQGTRYAAALAGTDPDDVPERAEQLAALLEQDGFMPEIDQVATPGGATVLKLKQGHCAIQDVAEAHPEVCAYEAALFRDLLGAKVSRRQTIATGADACVCHITVNDKTSR